VVEVAVQESSAGSYWPPVFADVPSKPPQAIILVPVHTAVWEKRAVGAPVVEVAAVQELESGSYWPPVLTELTPSKPPQTIILMPVHTAV
jgi:hypothetical protein